MAQNQQASYQQQVQANMAARYNLLQTGLAMNKRLSTVTASLGQQVKIPLLRMGIMTHVVLQVTVPVTIATNPAVLSSRGPWNLLQQIVYNDFAGVQRTRTNGYQLWAALSMKQADLLGSIPLAAPAGSGTGPTSNYDTNILSCPTAVGNGTLQFSIMVPMAYDPSSDLTGAVLTQTNVGEHYITLQIANALAAADPWIAPYLSSGGGVTLQAGAQITIEPFQFYIQPQNMLAENLPVMDLSMIYGFEGGYQNTANIASGQDTFINYPNNRSVFSSLIDFENGGAFTANGADLSQITLLANSNTNIRELTPRMLREIMRNALNGDLPTGSYYTNHRRQPIATQLYANVQNRFSVITANAGVTQLVSQFEVQYPSGAPLPGITVAA